MKNDIEIDYNSSVNLTTTQKRLIKDILLVFNKVMFKTITKKLQIKVNEIYISISICGDTKIKSLNSKFRNINKITDVLSFPIQENLKNGVYDPTPAMELGDIYICKSVALKQAKEASIHLRTELLHLMVHGFLHLCGYDHELSDMDEKEMFDLEDQLVKNCLKELKVK